MAYICFQMLASVAAGMTAILIFMNDIGIEEGDGGIGSKVRINVVAWALDKEGPIHSNP